MINNSEFANRLRQIMDYYQLSASGFADRIQVQRSSISHLLSGRNKPSLDFVMRVVKEFEEVELYWFLNGKGSFPTSEKTKAQLDISERNEPKTDKIVAPARKPETSSAGDNQIERIVVFYNDGSFKAYSP